MTNNTTNIEPTTTNLGFRRKEFNRNLLGLIDNAIGADEPKTNLQKSASTTAAVSRALDAKQPGRAIKLPPEVHLLYEPPVNTCVNISFKKDLGGIAPFNPVMAKVLLEAGTFITGDEKRALQAIQTKMDAFKAQLSKFSTTAATAEFYSQSHCRIVATMRTGALPEKPVRLLDSIHAEYAANRAALNAVLLDYYYEFFPLVIKLHARALEVVRSKMELLETQERGTAAAFGLAWHPSFLWKSLATILSRVHPDKLRCATDSDYPSTPAEMLEGILDL